MSSIMNDMTKMARMPLDLFAEGVDYVRKAVTPSDSEGQQEGSEAGSEGGEAASKIATGDELSGNDVKLVRARLMFTKPGHEKLLASWEDMVDYNTNRESYAGVKLARYLGSQGVQIPDEDLRFLRIHMEILDRFPKEDVNYEARRLDLLEQQVEIMGATKTSAKHRTE
jgi:hypothetical protein